MVGKVLFKLLIDSTMLLLANHIRRDDIRDLSQSELRSNIAVVPQDPVLFNESLEYNLKCGYINVRKMT